MKEEKICGLHAVQAALQYHPEQISQLWLLAGRDDAPLHALEEAAKSAGIPVHRVERARLERMLGPDSRHQGVVAGAQPVALREEKDLKSDLAKFQQKALLLVLDGIQDPHNLGACLRSAAAAGAQGVVMPRDRSAPVSPAARRAAAGAAEWLPIYRVSNLGRALEIMGEAGLWRAGAAGEASATIYEVDMTTPLALVLGAEGAGLRRLTRERCDQLVRIPMAATTGSRVMQSLNVSVAAGVCLFEAGRQRQVASRQG